MPIRITTEDEYVLVSAEDDFDMIDVRATLEEAAKRNGSKPLLRILVDARATDFRVTTDDVGLIVRIWQEVFRSRSVQIALVVSTDVQFGMGRMLGALSHETPVSYEVFRERDDAERWLLGKPYPPGP
ncbi:MAG: hypothetical protein QF570_19175 [Myxococcota bacterium]|jgi:hypothetical protein|nr:hypothetical protein [Myxococcota bacterium]